VSLDHGKAPYAFWQPLGAPALIGDPIVQCLALILLTSFLFLAFPAIDLWFSGLFYDPGNGFLVSRLKAFTAFRDILRDGTADIVIVAIAVVLIKLVWPHRRTLLNPRDIVFIVSTLAIGPGIITNLIFKSNWGRPRPVRVTDFGGDLPFVGVWKITDYCASNCSFISGEGSSAIWLLTLAVLLPARWRTTGIKVLLAFAAAFSLNRVAFGGHFLSDVLLAWWITLLVIAVEYRVLYVNPPLALSNQSMEDWLTQAGVGLRQGVASLWQAVTNRIGKRDEGP
jgi:lipid A 4'-phosphatase